ncbi:uncharacterized protein LOC135694036 isoform X2 [Rhopilema esculentum]|uniref:uncharacterized protein LOC135694036 isoform X2 n=1 Tax=Rhopilema esculentum TaxID=499914 RepID=UPI0031D1A282
MDVFPLRMCPENCSGHGICSVMNNGTCVCEVQFTGGSCGHSNKSFFIPFGVVFYLVCLTSFTQLVLCIRAEFQKLGTVHIANAFRLTVQKLLYVFVIIATGSRAVYFTVQDYIPEPWKHSLLSSYYPFIISGYSIIICFWAEIFHVGEHPADQRFLTKSYVACAIFNVLVYMLLFAQFISSKLTNIELKAHLTEVFNGLFAFLMFVVLVFFLIYGVEIFCKLKGKFTKTTSFETQINSNMVFQSRIGIIAQGLLQLATTVFLLIDVIGSSWKESVAIGDRNIVEIVFRVLELGVALWFPCVLWNVHKPEELWLLNPAKLLHRRKAKQTEASSLLNEKSKGYDTFQSNDSDDLAKVDLEENCWICYDTTRTDVGQLISPCNCKGDTSIVHEGCLKKWLLESLHDLEESPTCKICKAQYNVHETSAWYSFVLHKRACLQSCLIISLIVFAPVATGLSLHLLKMDFVKIIAIGGLMLFEYLCFRLLGVNIFSTLRRARIQAFRILDAKSEDANIVEEEIDADPSEIVPI